MRRTTCPSFRISRTYLSIVGWGALVVLGTPPQKPKKTAREATMLRNVRDDYCRHDARIVGCSQRLRRAPTDAVSDLDRLDFTVSLVDDDAGVLMAISSLLRAAGYKTETFSSPITFLAAYDHRVPGCAVL